MNKLFKFISITKYFFLACSLLSTTFLTGEWVKESKAFLSFCKKASSDPSLFSDFRRNSAFQQFEENLTYEEGQVLYGEIKENYPHLLSYFDIFKSNEAFGNPITHRYGHFHLSPSTLSYIKIAGELQKNFGDLTTKHLVEIGGGYGGQCKIIHDLGGFASYIIIDLPECNVLSKRYLEAHGIKNVTFVDKNCVDEKEYGIVIAHGFGKIDKREQEQLVNLVLKNSSGGYLTGEMTPNFPSLPLEEFIFPLYEAGLTGKGETLTEPSSSYQKFVVSWKKKEETFIFGKELPKLFPSQSNQRENAIAYSFSGGRLGDNLLAYFHAKWIAYKYNLPFIYIPFSHSNRFGLDFLDQTSNGLKFVRKVALNNSLFKEPSKKGNSTLYVVPYFPEEKFDFKFYERYKDYQFFEVDWEDSWFKQELKRCLEPKEKIKTMDLPEGILTLGVHIRRSKEEALSFPTKMPQDSYFIEQIERVTKIFKDRPIFVHILTDDPNPEQIISTYQEALNNPQLTFSSRPTPKDDLEDFYLIPKFDCLIYAQSNFSIIASKLGDYCLKIVPKSAIVKNEVIMIDRIEIGFNGESSHRK